MFEPLPGDSGLPPGVTGQDIDGLDEALNEVCTVLEDNFRHTIPALVRKEMIAIYTPLYLKRKAIRLLVKRNGYRLAADAWPALDAAVAALLMRAARYTKPAKTIRGREIELAVGKNGGDQ